jgi:hypothetical protein
VLFERLPDRIAGYATYELALLLGKLSGGQRAAIDRIVQHVFIDNRPWAELFRGENRICAEANYYRRGRLDPATGEFARGHKPGWGHDPDFQAALQEAVKLALGSQERERLGWLQRAKRRAEERAAAAVDTWVGVMIDSMDDKARNDAAGRVIDLAFKGSGDATDTGAREEADWWAAAGGEDDG